MRDAEIQRLPDPQAFGDARLLAVYGRFSPEELDAADFLTMQLVWRLRGVK